MYIECLKSEQVPISDTLVPSGFQMPKNIQKLNKARPFYIRTCSNIFENGLA